MQQNAFGDRGLTCKFKLPLRNPAYSNEALSSYKTGSVSDHN